MINLSTWYQKVRVNEDIYNGWEICTWYLWFPIWICYGCHTFATREIAIKFAKKKYGFEFENFMKTKPRQRKITLTRKEFKLLCEEAISGLLYERGSSDLEDQAIFEQRLSEIRQLKVRKLRPHKAKTLTKQEQALIETILLIDNDLGD